MWMSTYRVFWNNGTIAVVNSNQYGDVKLVSLKKIHECTSMSKNLNEHLCKRLESTERIITLVCAYMYATIESVPPAHHLLFKVEFIECYCILLSRIVCCLQLHIDTLWPVIVISDVYWRSERQSIAGTDPKKRVRKKMKAWLTFLEERFFWDRPITVKINVLYLPCGHDFLCYFCSYAMACTSFDVLSHPNRSENSVLASEIWMSFAVHAFYV